VCAGIPVAKWRLPDLLDRREACEPLALLDTDDTRDDRDPRDDGRDGASKAGSIPPPSSLSDDMVGDDVKVGG